LHVPLGKNEFAAEEAQAHVSRPRFTVTMALFRILALLVSLLNVTPGKRVLSHAQLNKVISLLGVTEEHKINILLPELARRNRHDSFEGTPMFLSQRRLPLPIYDRCSR